MKKINFLLLTITLLVCKINFGQVGIGTATPHPSSKLDISSTNSGLLIPRMNTGQRTGIPSPATGLQVFDTDTKSVWFYNGIGWAELTSGSSANLWSLSGTHIYNSNTGNVGIGLTTPLAPLHIKNDNEAVRIQGTTPFVSFYNNAGSLRGFIQQYNDTLLIGTPSTNTNGIVQFYVQNQPVMTLRNGAVSIGASPFTFADFSVGRNLKGIAIYNYPEITDIISTGNISLNTALGTGYVGIQTYSPKNKLQIGSVGATSFATNDFAIGNGTNAMAIFQSNASTLIGATTDIVLRPRNDGTGNVGINVLTPTNKLQIGSMGNTGLATNDLAIGNGTAAMAIYQTNDATLIGSTTDIILKPRNNGTGRIGINTNTPRAPLDVISGVLFPNSYYDWHNEASSRVGIGRCSPCTPTVSIRASDAVFASEFDANSDARIKDIVGVSNSMNDLQTINAVQVTDYTMLDKVKHGNRQFKKVIAQEVEKVYPQVVSKHTDFIPNVYQLTSSLKPTSGGYLLSFTTNHHISKSAKKLQVLVEEAGMQQFNIVSIPSDKEVVISATGIKTDKVFVYGEEVDDFRTVDYEGLTTLNISATQELSKLLKKQQAAIDTQAKKIEQLTQLVNSLKDTKFAVLKTEE